MRHRRREEYMSPGDYRGNHDVQEDDETKKHEHEEKEEEERVVYLHSKSSTRQTLKA